MRNGRHGKGFTYVGLLILVAIIGISSVAALRVGALVQRRSAEEELLFVGMEYRKALLSYANATPVGQQRLPRTLDDLLKDPRYPGTRRHLRKPYADPMTGKQQWGLLQAPDGSGITGIYSLSDAAPIKVGMFEPELADFTGSTSYREWRFTILPPEKLRHQNLNHASGALDNPLRRSTGQ